jgi:hypothetical protein
MLYALLSFGQFLAFEASGRKGFEFDAGLSKPPTRTKCALNFTPAKRIRFQRL